jgi:hypothetical protein
MISTGCGPAATPWVRHLKKQGGEQSEPAFSEQNAGYPNTVERVAGACEFARYLTEHICSLFLTLCSPSQAGVSTLTRCARARCHALRFRDPNRFSPRPLRVVSANSAVKPLQFCTYVQNRLRGGPTPCRVVRDRACPERSRRGRDFNVCRLAIVTFVDVDIDCATRIPASRNSPAASPLFSGSPTSPALPYCEFPACASN